MLCNARDCRSLELCTIRSLWYKAELLLLARQDTALRRYASYARPLAQRENTARVAQCQRNGIHSTRGQIPRRVTHHPFRVVFFVVATRSRNLTASRKPPLRLTMHKRATRRNGPRSRKPHTTPPTHFLPPILRPFVCCFDRILTSQERKSADFCIFCQYFSWF